MGNCSNGNKEDVVDPKNCALTRRDIELIKNSWKLVVKHGLKEYGVNMMIRIFVEHKELKPLWRFSRGLETTDQMKGSYLLRLHGEKLFNAIDMAINSLEDLETLVPVLIQLGFSHYKWGVRDEHFAYIADALIGTLQDGIKENFNEKVKKSWIKVFGFIESQMKIGMRQAEAESRAIQLKPNDLKINLNDDQEEEKLNSYKMNNKH